jgi:metal-responsive CopG/Arc/MetJ family transcriptional regulator
MDMESFQISAKIPRDLVEWIDAYAEQHHWSRANAIKVILESFRDQQEQAEEGE